MTHPYAASGPEEVLPEDGVELIEFRYGSPGGLRDLAIAAALTVVWILVYLVNDLGWSAFVALGWFWVTFVGLMWWQARKIESDTPVLLSVSEIGLRHWAVGGTRLERFFWDEVASVELEKRLPGPSLAIYLKPEARRRMSYGPLGVGRPRFTEADYVIPLSRSAHPPSEVIDAVDAVLERRLLERVRDAGVDGSDA